VGQYYKDPVTQLGGKYEPLRNALIGMLTGTTFPCPSLNGGPSLVPEKLSNAYLRFTRRIRSAEWGQGDHVRSPPEVGQQTLEEMFLEYVPPARRYRRVG